MTLKIFNHLATTCTPALPTLDHAAAAVTGIRPPPPPCTTTFDVNLTCATTMSSSSVRKPSLRRTTSDPLISRFNIPLISRLCRRPLATNHTLHPAPDVSAAPTRPAETFGQYVTHEMTDGPELLRHLLYTNNSSSKLLEANFALPLPYAPRNTRLNFIECRPDGVIVRRVQTRHEILTEVRQNWDSFYDPNVQRLPRRQPRATRDETADTSTNRRGRHPRGKPARLASRLLPPQTPHTALPDKRTSGNKLSVRDMRQIDPSFTAKPAIWVREDAMVVSLESVRAIILYNKMFIFDPDNKEVDKSLGYIVRRLANNLEDAFLPFEFRALEGILIHACIVLEREFSAIEPGLRETLGGLPTQINNEQLERLRSLEQRLNYYYSRARKVQQALQSVLDEDEDMADMYLTEKRKNPSLVRNPIDHDEAEMLLETYLQTVEDLTSKAGLLNQAIDDTENLIEIHLDTMQNRLLLVDLIITAISTILAFGTMVTSIFGMNFRFPDEMAELPSSKFYFLGSILIMVMIMGIGLVILTRWCRREGIYRGRSKSSRRREGEKAAVVKLSEETKRQAEALLAKRDRNSYGNRFDEWRGNSEDLLQI